MTMFPKLDMDNPLHRAAVATATEAVHLHMGEVASESLDATVKLVGSTGIKLVIWAMCLTVAEVSTATPCRSYQEIKAESEKLGKELFEKCMVALHCDCGDPKKN